MRGFFRTSLFEGFRYLEIEATARMTSLTDLLEFGPLQISDFHVPRLDYSELGEAQVLKMLGEDFRQY